MEGSSKQVEEGKRSSMSCTCGLRVNEKIAKSAAWRVHYSSWLLTLYKDLSWVNSFGIVYNEVFGLENLPAEVNLMKYITQANITPTEISIWMSDSSFAPARADPILFTRRKIDLNIQLRLVGQERLY